VTAWIPELSQDKRECIFDTAPPQLFPRLADAELSARPTMFLSQAGWVDPDGWRLIPVRRRLSLPGSTRRTCPGVRCPGMAGVFQVSAKAASPAEFRIIERLIRDEIAALAAKGPTGEELRTGETLQDPRVAPPRAANRRLQWAE